MEDEESDEYLKNRTNNPIESYNRTLNESFVYSHPTMEVFVDVIKNKSLQYVKKLNMIAAGKMERPEHQPTSRFEIPDDYYNRRVKKNKK